MMFNNAVCSAAVPLSGYWSVYAEWLMIHGPRDYHPLGLERDNEESYMIARAYNTSAVGSA